MAAVIRKFEVEKKWYENAPFLTPYNRVASPDPVFLPESGSGFHTSQDQPPDPGAKKERALKVIH